MDERKVNNYLDKIYEELERATQKFSAFNSIYEGYAVIKEELDELWDAVRHNDIKQARKEAVQVGAMALRFLYDTDWPDKGVNNG